MLSASLLQYVRRLAHRRETVAQTPPLPYTKAANREDYHNTTFWELIRGIFLHDQLRYADNFPLGREDRHYWQTAMTARTFADHGVLGPNARVLGDGAGNDPIVFWLTNKVAQVFATDLYLAKGSRAATVCPGMLAEPERHWPGSWNSRRLVVQHMSPQELRYSDESFDAVFAPHALDSCLTLDEVERALEEMYRVLKPGGVVSLHVNFAIDQTGNGPGGRLMHEWVLKEKIAALPWTYLGKVDLGTSQATRQTEAPAEMFTADLRRHLEQHGQLFWHEIAWSRYPHLVVRDGEVISVPAHLALRKPTGRG
jgi:ubiquinone/menaquinone biosynthesis C-methylase UbiE